MKLIRQMTAACLAMFLTFAVWAPPAAAHTGFESSDPADGSVTNEPVDAITLVFTGDAEPTGDGFQLLDPDGAVREPTEASTADGRTWVLLFDPPITGGSVGVRWMVKAPDAHPIDGAFSFSTPATPVPPFEEPRAVDAAPDMTLSANGPLDQDAAASMAPQLDEPSAGTEQEAASVDSESVPPAAAPVEQVLALEEFLDTGDDVAAAPGRVGAAGRFITLLGTLIGIGGLVFAATAMRGRRRDVRLVLFWVRRAGLAVVAGALIEFTTQVATEDAGNWSALWSPSAVGGVIASTFGIATGLRIVGGIALATGARLDTIAASEIRDPVVAVRQLVSAGVAGAGTDAVFWELDTGQDGMPQPNEDPLVRPGDQAWRAGHDSAGAGLGALAILAAHLFDGHTVTKGNRLLTGAVDIIHVAGSAIWAGGVLMLAAVLWHRHREGRELRARQLAMRFSVVATAALVAVGLAGVVLAIIVLDSPSELWSTDWGRILIAKTTFVGIAAVAGGYNHKVLIPALETAPDDADLSLRFRNVITGEAVALVAVAVATALLMGAAS
jgi:copper transport protein